MGGKMLAFADCIGIFRRILQKTTTKYTWYVNSIPSTRSYAHRKLLHSNEIIRMDGLRMNWKKKRTDTMTMNNWNKCFEKINKFHVYACTHFYGKPIYINVCVYHNPKCRPNECNECSPCGNWNRFSIPMSERTSIVYVKLIGIVFFTSSHYIFHILDIHFHEEKNYTLLICNTALRR